MGVTLGVTPRQKFTKALIGAAYVDLFDRAYGNRTVLEGFPANKRWTDRVRGVVAPPFRKVFRVVISAARMLSRLM